MNGGRAPDHAVRMEAVEGRGSYVVQAPAGSGKTELLVQRFLRLLGEVTQPEAVLAITFTNKSAAEMRGRICDALASGGLDEPLDGHQAQTWRLARRALQSDHRKGWNLKDNPRRLRVQTIDSFCAELSRQMPVLSGFGATPAPTDDAAHFYSDAAKAALAGIDDESFGEHVEVVLGHLDGNADKFVRLIGLALAKREQWLRHVVHATTMDRSAMELSLGRLVSAVLISLSERVPGGLAAKALEVLHNAAEFRALTEGEALWLEPALGCPSAGDVTPQSLPVWQALAKFLLTQTGTLRQRHTRKEGVPGEKVCPPSHRALLSEHKAAVAAVREALSACPGAVATLARVQRLPNPTYSDQQWRVVNALLASLSLAAAHLQVNFATQDAVDFSEIQLRALTALGTAEVPSDLLLKLDARVEHILVDEFQDTSFSQKRLLEHLCAGWQPEDGRSVFLVGDPMQSIYRFREAQVGLFLAARQRGIGELRLEPLTLTANFRSGAPIVEWVNGAFAQIFPAHDDPDTGAVSFASAVSQVPGRPGDGVNVHPVVDGDEQREADIVLGVIRETLARYPGDSVAVLVRSRAHLSQLVPKLRAVRVDFQAVDVELLARRPVVQELHAMVSALLQPADGIAWLGVLRAPWCGLDLNDLHGLFSDPAAWPARLAGTTLEPSSIASQTDAVGPSLDDSPGPPDPLSEGGEARLRVVVDAFSQARSIRALHGLSRTIESLWQQLGGPHCLTDPAALDDARRYLELLGRHERAGDLRDMEAFQRALAKLYAAPGVNNDAPVQLMTIHKSKGLEFDTVILPGLGKSPRAQSLPIVLNAEQVHNDGTVDVIVAPIEAPGEPDALFQYLKQADSERDAQETARLLYVAVTRAKRRLHLVGRCPVAADGENIQAPPKSSLLHRLWPLLQEDFDAAPRHSTIELEDAGLAPRLRRVTEEWLALRPVPDLRAVSGAQEVDPDVEFDWAGESARHVGTVVHRWLERMAQEGLARWPRSRVENSQPNFAVALGNLGVPDSDTYRASGQVSDALVAVLDDDRARWIMAPHGGRAQSEFALMQASGQTTRELIVDRTFVDDAGIRWVIDYKTGGHEGGDVETFLDSEVLRYRDQLEGYADALNALDPRPTRLGLYFPLIGGWREWSAPDANG
ncbi:MAG: UvrD-helicase domain-containing protein [Chromatiales bacterium]|jgi:ATP-dependent helicase/nuclease subunit A|nr:UvrD-helicase domain-containing protein [Chromatiales bacterium]